MPPSDSSKPYFPPPRSRTPPADPRALFARDAEAVVRRCAPEAAIHFAPVDFALKIEDANGAYTFFLDNVFAETREMSPADREARIAALTMAFRRRDVPSEWASIAPRLAPVLRATSLVAAIPDPRKAIGYAELITRPFLPFLKACLVVDDAGTMSFVQAEQIAASGLSLDDIFALANANLATLDAEHGVALYDASVPYPIWHVAHDDSYQSSRLLLPGWLAAFGGKVHGRPIAIVPTRDQMFVSGDADARAIERLLVTAEREFAASTRHVSPAIYTVAADGSVIPFIAPAAHALHARTRVAHYKLAIYEYAQQKEVLDRRLAREGKDVFVASLRGVESPKAGPLSFTTWAERTDSLLPVADAVAMGRAGGGESIFVPWGALIELASPWIRVEPGSDPPRMRTSGWPDQATMGRLAARAIAL
jgi:hypothetical protein